MSGSDDSALKQVERLLAESEINSELASIVYTLLRKPTPDAFQAPAMVDQMPVISVSLHTSGACLASAPQF